MESILVSACLLGLKCRYDGKCIKDEETLKLFKNEKAIPVCGEQLGGLTTPREPSEEVDGRILSISGKDVTENFNQGAADILKIAKLLKVKKAYLKNQSPMCGCGEIYDGTFTGKLIKGDGVLTKLLKENNIEVIPVK